MRFKASRIWDIVQVNYKKKYLITSYVTIFLFISSRYHESIGHAIHSLSVQGLRIFDPSATKNNDVPTVNMNLSANKKVINGILIELNLLNCNLLFKGVGLCS